MRARSALSIASLVVGFCAAPPTAAQELAMTASPAARLQAPALAGPGALRLRWGVDLGATPEDGAQPFVGIGLVAGRRTTLFYEQAHADAASAWPSRTTPDATTRVGLEFRTGSTAAAWRDFGTLRLQVGLHSRLTVKPRRDGLKLTWQTRF